MAEQTLALGAMAPGPTVVRVRNLTSDEVQTFRDGNRTVHDYLSQQALFEIFLANAAEYLALGTATRAQFSQDHQMTQNKLRTLIQEANRLLLNLLTSFRTFLDHSETNMKHKYGQSSAEVAEFKNACSREYDKRFAYRFMYRLRNYAQHCGMPLRRIVVTDKVKRIADLGKEDAETIQVVRFWFNGQDLLRDYDGWSTVSRDLAQRPRIQVDVQVKSLVAGARGVNKVVERLSARTYRIHARELRALMEVVRVLHPDAVPVILELPRRISRRRLALRYRQFPTAGMHQLMPRDLYLQRFIAGEPNVERPETVRR